LAQRHVERTRRWANDPELMRLLNRAAPVSEAEHERWFAALAGCDDRHYFAIETSAGAHVGNVWLWDIDRRHRKAELRIVIGEPDGQNRGLGPTAIDLACAHAFEELDLHRVYAFVLSINPRAKRAFQRAGFQCEGVLRDERWLGDRYCDSYLLARLSGGELNS
jgi:RimJ/RimL family protein N-acetyltransferase